LINLIKITTGKILSAALAFMVSVIIARKLGASDFGFVTISLSVAIITNELIGSEGIDNGMVRFASIYLNTNKKRANMLYKIALKIKFIIVAIVILLSTILFNTLLFSVTSKPEIRSALIFGIFTGCFISFWRYILAFLQSFQSFMLYAFIDITPNLIKIIIIFLLISIGSLNLNNVLLVNAAAIILGFIIGFLFIPKDFISAKGKQREIALKLFDFSKWIFITNILGALWFRLDILMLSYYKNAELVGVYSVALSFISAMNLLFVSLLTKYFPQVSRLNKKNEFFMHIKKSLLISFGLAILLSFMFFIAEPIIVLAYTERYIDSIIYFKILLTGFLFSLVFNPLLLVLYALNKPYIITFICLFLVIANFCGNLLLIPKYGAIGAAFVVALTRVAGGLLILFYTLIEVSKLDSPIHVKKT
jgi:O-antigen/teichoic acid export membrane protein